MPPDSLSHSPASIDQFSWCPPHRSGSACNRPMFPACAAMWSLDSSELAPCFRGPQSIPVSCNCLVQCEEAGHAAVADCIHGSPTLHLPVGPRVNLSAITPPWSGHPKELRRSWPELRVRYDPALYAKLHGAGRASRSSGRCSGRGIAARLVQSDVGAVLWPAGVPRPKPHSCACAPGFGGQSCAPLEWHASDCLNSCSNAGRCVAGTCVCASNAQGIDCSGGVATALPTDRHTAEVRIRAPSPLVFVYELPPPFTSWLSLPRLRGANGCGQPSLQHGPEPCWWQVTDPMYSVDTRLLNRLLASPHRTQQPEEADFFYIPLMLSLGFVSHRFGIYLPSAPAARLIEAAVGYVRAKFPFWNRTGGGDHMLPFTGDDGAAWLRGRLPLLEHAIFLTHWGFRCNGARLRRNPLHCVRAQLGFRSHRSGQDVVLPPLHSPHALLPKALWLGGLKLSTEESAPDRTAAQPMLDAVLAPNRNFTYLLYFVGKVNRSKREGDVYSGGIRQRIYEQHHARVDFYLRSRPGARGRDADIAALGSSKFCLSPHGTGFGMRQFDAIAHGCVPLIVKVRWEEDPHNGGTLEQPYADVLPWNALAHVELTRADIPRLPQILTDFPLERHAAMRRAAACAWPRLFWLPIPTGMVDEPVHRAVEPNSDVCGGSCKDELRRLAAHDAFGTLMMTLAHRARLRMLQRRHQALLVPPAATLVDLPSPTHPQTFEKVRMAAFVTASASAATRWSRLEDDWRNGGRLAAAAWRTPAISCERALRIEEAQHAEQAATQTRPKGLTTADPQGTPDSPSRRRLLSTGPPAAPPSLSLVLHGRLGSWLLAASDLPRARVQRKKVEGATNDSVASERNHVRVASSSNAALRAFAGFSHSSLWEHVVLANRKAGGSVRVIIHSWTPEVGDVLDHLYKPAASKHEPPNPELDKVASQHSSMYRALTLLNSLSQPTDDLIMVARLDLLLFTDVPLVALASAHGASAAAAASSSATPSPRDVLYLPHTCVPSRLTLAKGPRAFESRVLRRACSGTATRGLPTGRRMLPVQLTRYQPGAIQALSSEHDFTLFVLDYFFIGTPNVAASFAKLAERLPEVSARLRAKFSGRGRRNGPGIPLWSHLYWAEHVLGTLVPSGVSLRFTLLHEADFTLARFWRFGADCLTRVRWRDASSGARAYTKTDKEGEHDAWALDDEAFAAFDNVTASARGLRASGRRALQGSPLTEQCPLSLESGKHILCPWFSKACASGARSTLRHAETAGKFQTEAGLSPRQLMGAERCVTQACLKHSGTARKPRRSDRALLARSTAVWESGFRSGRRDPRSPVQTLQSAL